ncbi:hypothetical protein [Tabrizicola sp.]|uniref:cadherin repeat domain-containing protein n=1 Tax=Tabrizicola sp. TaxID=2005166 RepID=UPI003F3D6BD8
MASTYFIQNSTTGAFGGTQGNDLSGTLRLVLNSGQTIDIPGAINWRISQGATPHYFGFIPAPGPSYTIVYGSNQTYTLNSSSNYGLRKIGSTVSYADGSNASGNAATSGLVALLNDYLTVVRATGPQVTGPSGVAGATTSAKTVDEGQTAVTTMTANKAVGWALFGGADAGAFAIDTTTGVLTFLTAPDFEMPTDADANNTYVVTVQATDSSGYTAQQTVTVTVVDLDDTPPLITGAAAASVPEGQTAVAAFTANEAVVWTLAGIDSTAFTVSASGAVSFLTAPDRNAPADANGDNVYELTITATDTAGHLGQLAFTVTVIAVAPGDTTPPVISGPAAASVAEGQATVVSYTVDEMVTWSLGGPDGAAFAVDAAGAVTFLTAPDLDAPADADGDNVYGLTITATDAAGNLSQQALTVTVTEVIVADATPPIITGPSGTGQAQSAAVTDGETAVTTFIANEAATWSVDGGDDAGAFTIDAGTGALSFTTSPSFSAPTDADGDNVYLVTIAATDPAGNRSSQTLAVTVAAPVDTTPPTISGLVAGTVNLPEGQMHVASFSSNEAVVWSISGLDAGAFSIAETGELAFTAPPNHAAPGDADGDNVYVVAVVAIDAAGNSSQHVLTVTVTKVIVPDTTPPAVNGPSGAEGATAFTMALPEGQTAVTDFAADEPVTWSITGGPDQSALAVDPATGAVRFVITPDFDVPSDADGNSTYVIVLTATDTAGNRSTVTLTVMILDADDTVAEVFDGHDEDIVEIVEEIERNHLRSSLTSLRGMTIAARDRFIAAQRMRESCRDDDDLAATAALAGCSRIASRNDIPFGLQGQVQVGRGGSFATGTFYGQAGSFDGTRRRIIEGNYAFVDSGAGVTTVDITGRIAWERLVSERVMLGFFVGGSFSQADIRKRLTGRSDKVSLSLGSYFVAELRPELYLDGFLSVAASRNMLALRNGDIQVDGTYAAQSLLMGLALSGVIARDGYELRPEIALAYGATRIRSLHLDATAADTTEAFTATVEAVDFATLRITPELRIPLYAQSDAALYIIAPSVVCDWTDDRLDCGGGLRLGLQGTSRDRRTRFDIMFEADQIGGKDRMALGAQIEHRF